VSIKRIDDLVDDNGNLLAKRISAVIVNFELKDDHFLLDSVPVKLGVNSVHVINAEVIPAGIKDDEIRKYDENFAIGLVKVEVNTKVESTSPLRKIIITIKIIEIDGVKISSTNTVEKIWEFNLLEVEDGDQNSEILPIPPVDDSTLSLPHRPCSSSFRSLSRRIRHWWRCSSRHTRIFLSSLLLTAVFGVFFLLISAAINAVISLVSSQNKFKKYQRVLQEDEDGKYKSMHGEVEQVIFVADDYKLES